MIGHLVFGLPQFEQIFCARKLSFLLFKYLGGEWLVHSMKLSLTSQDNYCYISNLYGLSSPLRLTALLHSIPPIYFTCANSPISVPVLSFE